jgi:hypothetical protein
MLAYTITELGLPGGTTYPIGSAAYDINDSGVAVGWIDDWYIEPGGVQEARACRWSGGGAAEILPDSPFDGSAGHAINGDGEIVGPMRDTGPNVGGYYFKDGQLTDLSPVLGQTAEPSDVNSFGVVCGSVGPMTSYRPFTYDTYAGGQPVHLNPLTGSAVTCGISINDSGHVVGISGPWTSADRKAALYRGGPDGEDLGDALYATAINNADVVTGQKLFHNAPAATAYRLDAATPGKPSFEDLGHSQLPGFEASTGWAINNTGTVVGYSYAPNVFGKQRAFVHIPSGPDAGFHDLQDLVVDGAGWELWQALGVNNGGAIVGFGLHNGDFRGWLLTPTDASSMLTKVLDDEIAEALVAWFGVGPGPVERDPGLAFRPSGKPWSGRPEELKLRWRRMPPAERDAYAALAVRALASRLHGRKRSELLRRAATEVIDDALSELEHRG